MLTFSLLPEKWSFHVANFRKTGKKCTAIIKAREGRAKVLLVFIKYAKFVALSLPSRRRSSTPYFLDENAERGYGKIQCCLDKYSFVNVNARIIDIEIKNYYFFTFIRA